MTAGPVWADAQPLPGCEGIRSDVAPAPPAPAPSQPKKKPNAVVRKLVLTNRFYDKLTSLEPRLSPLAVAVWGWLWRCEREGLARTSVARLSDRFGKADRTIRRALAELRDRGFLVVVRRGRPPDQPTVYRVRPTPRNRAD